MKKKPKEEKPRLVKVSNIECTNGNRIVIGQRRRETETEPIVWEYDVLNTLNESIAHGERPTAHEAFMNALPKATGENVNTNHV